MEMVAVMQRAAEQDEENNAVQQQVLADMLAENERLRALLQLQLNSSNASTDLPAVRDLDTQTWPVTTVIMCCIGGQFLVECVYFHCEFVWL